ncbi:histidine--tRNA ligase [Niveibacterium sp. 24ML]|uniref:histidine--tRNA ligase n=1 Tax=Niveibacterium sp. 24ML TaxID=2985512 RepID=UPI00226D8EA7|nr:histidine--tRNA ligase [Niveibacterium sp. 24ML]MCX9155094.1 histidine--tRNA ligase [Niveibacterium sp. 24ML]
MAQKLIQGVKGMHDILPEDAERWELFEEIVRGWLRDYGYRPIRTPILEFTPLFVRSVGEHTDIVEREMYAFEDRLNGDPLVLRPEGTAPCVRAVLEHNLINAAGPQRLYYNGPMFRHERPQKGRLRQFHQFGVEAFGYAGPDIDAEHIVMLSRLWRDLGLEDDIWLEINSLGASEERARHREALIAYLETHIDLLDDDARRRLHSNPLRILDTKNPALQAVVEAAPKLYEFLGVESLAHFEGVQALLREAAVPFKVNHRLVRGLDYYNRTVFEWVTDKLGAQATVCGGGRYDGLVEQLGGKPTPACGFGMGIERLMMLWAEVQADSVRAEPDVYLVHQGEAASRLAFRVAEQLRDHGFAVIYHCGGGNFKNQMKKADASGARVAVIIGDDEAAAEEASFKFMREEGEQRRLPVAQLGETLAALLYNVEEEDGSV